MPNLGESNQSSNAQLSLVKLLLLGDTKAGKTDYVMQAARAGFNILVLDGDVAIQTLMNESRLPKEFRDRIFYMPIHDRTGDNGAYESTMAKFFVEFATSGVLTWNDTKGELFDKSRYMQDFDRTDPENPRVIDGDKVWQIRPSKIGGDTIVLLDSWTTLIASLINWKADDLSIDLLDAEKHGRDMYTGAGHKATQFLTLLRGFRSHVVVIGHPREYQKRSAPPGSKGQVAEKDMKLDWIKMVPISTSNPHALTMGKHFSDIAWINVTAMGKREISFKPEVDRVSGGHFEGKGEVEVFSLANLVRQVGGSVPSPISPADSTPWLTRYGPGEFFPAGPATRPLTGSSPATAKPVGLAGLMKPKGATG